MGNDPTPRPGFDFWVSFPGQGKIIDPPLFENGRLEKVPGYVTDLLTDRALGFIHKQRGAQRPYFLYLAHKAVHPDAIQRDDGSLDLVYGTHYIAAERHRGRNKNEIFPRSRLPRPLRRERSAASWFSDSSRESNRKRSCANLETFSIPE